jgi:site-specific recombinase XerD
MTSPSERRAAQSPTLDQLADSFFRSRRRHGMIVPGTEVAYTWAYNHLRRFLERRRLDLDGLEPHHIEEFMDELTADDLSPASRRIAASALRGLFEHGLVSGVKLNPHLHLAAGPIRVRRGLPRPIPPEDLRRLLAYVLPRRRSSVVELRDRALFLFLLGSSARVSEALQVRRTDYEAPVVTQKGGYEKRLVAPRVVLDAIHDYLGARTDASDFLWVTFDNNRPTHALGRDGAWVAWQRMARRVGAKPFSTHQIRHTAATLLLDADLNPMAIANYLGHADLRTVSQYAKVSIRHKQAAVDALQVAIAGPPPARPARLRPPAPEEELTPAEEQRFLAFLAKHFGQLAAAGAD